MWLMFPRQSNNTIYAKIWLQALPCLVLVVQNMDIRSYGLILPLRISLKHLYFACADPT